MTGRPTGERVEQALAASFIGQCSDGTRGRLVAGALLIDIPAGAVFYRNEDAPRLGVVVTGLVRVFLTSPEGRQLTVRYARPGEILGAPTAVAGPVDVSAQALVESSLLMLDVTAVRSVARVDPDVGWALAEEVSHRLYDVLEAFAGNVFGTVRQRLARHLLDLAADRQQGAALVARVGQQDLADAVGTAREVVARTLHDLREAGLIETARNRVVLVDPARLSEVAATGEL